MYEPDAQKHADSSKKYPQLNLSDGEFVVADVKRHPIGLFSIWFMDLLLVAFILAISAFIASRANDLADAGLTLSPDLILAGMALVTILVLVFGWIGATIYSDNHFYVTNECVIQKVRTGLFAGREQTISLGGVEDASYTQNGILQYLLGYGSIRLSTVGDETTYRFNLVSNPKTQLDALNSAVESFKLRSHGMDQPQPASAPASDQTS